MLPNRFSVPLKLELEVVPVRKAVERQQGHQLPVSKVPRVPSQGQGCSQFLHSWRLRSTHDQNSRSRIFRFRALYGAAHRSKLLPRHPCFRTSLSNNRSDGRPKDAVNSLSEIVAFPRRPTLEARFRLPNGVRQAEIMMFPTPSHHSRGALSYLEMSYLLRPLNWKKGEEHTLHMR